MKKSIGYNISYRPKETPQIDNNDPHFGSLSIRGKTFVGKVISDSMDKTVKVEWERLVRDGKYNRYLKKRTKVSAHNPVSINAKKGDVVLIAQSRPISKTKHFVVVEIKERAKENESN